MVEVVFEDSAAGSLQQALVGRYKVAEAGIVLYVREEGEDPLSPEEEAQLRAAERRRQQEEAQRQRQGWAESLPLPGQLGDILVFHLAHSVGEITEEGIGPQREAALRKVMGIYPSLAEEVTQTLLARGRASLEALLTRAGAGEAVRVWTGPGPDDACGLAWLAHTLRPLGLEKVSVTQVVLPDFWERPDGTVIRWNSWGEMEPWMWGRPTGGVFRRPGGGNRAGEVPAGHRRRGTGLSAGGHGPGGRTPAGDLPGAERSQLPLPPAKDPRGVVRQSAKGHGPFALCVFLGEKPAHRPPT